MTDNNEIRTRIAPSPTGLFHIGNARAALFNWLYARKTNGKFILRIEDTDRERSKEEYELDITDCLSWLGLGWDEGPETPDLYGPYRQSERSTIYKKYADKLLEEGKAYECFCTQEDLEKERKDQVAKKLPPKYSGKCCSLKPEDITAFKKEGRKPSLRFKVPKGETVKWDDLIHGKMEFKSDLIGDFVVVKPNGDPIFLLSNIIDDSEMKISHVIRGDDHLSNTPKQLLLADAMNLSVPEYGHLPLILNPDRTKVSKRKNPTSVSHDFKDKGYLPEAIINFMVFLGWTPARLASQQGVAGRLPDEAKDRQFFTLDELVGEFDLSDVGKSPAVFDVQKLDYINGYYIRKMPLGELSRRCLPYLVKAGLVEKENEVVLNVISLVQERMKRLEEAPELTEFFFKRPKYEAELLVGKKSNKETTLQALQESHRVLSEETDYSRDSIEQLLRAMGQKIGIDAGKILWPIRVALSGRPASPGAFELAEFFGKTETLERIKVAIDMLK